MSKKGKDFESGKGQTSIYGNFLVIAEKWTLTSEHLWWRVTPHEHLIKMIQYILRWTC
jgi:hypothetical protein